MANEKEFILTEDELHVSYLHQFPLTPGTTIVEPKPSVLLSFRILLSE